MDPEPEDAPEDEPELLPDGTPRQFTVVFDHSDQLKLNINAGTGK